MCTAISPEDAFDGVIHEQINKINAMNTLVSNLKKQVKKVESQEDQKKKDIFTLVQTKF